MKNKTYVLLLIFTASSRMYADDFAQTKQQINQMAAYQTQQLLNNPILRQAAINTDQARKADQTVSITSLGDKNVSNDIYGIAGDLVPWLAEVGQGDSSAMQNVLLNAQSSSEGLTKFIESLPAAQREKIRAVAGQIEKTRNLSKPVNQIRP